MSQGKFTNEHEMKEINVSDLRVGMYVAKLDRPWLDTPFLMQGFLIESRDDIEVVAEYCEHVFIDAVREKWVPPEERFTSDFKQDRKVKYIHKVEAQDEHRKALGVYRASKKITKGLMEKAALQGLVDTEEAKNTVDGCVQSVIRNPNALLWMSRVREMDEYTSEHSINVCIYAVSFGRFLGLEEKELQDLGLCALLHDVGKMRVPPEILNKSDKLSDKEFKMIKAHTVHGRNLLMSSPGMLPAAIDVAYGHHERMDGDGYPRKIKGNGTSTFSRIVAIVDAYDAMTAERCYAPSIPSTDALKNIFQDRATHFDDRLAKEFIKFVGLYPPGTLVELVNGMIGIVLASNPEQNRLPKIIVVLDRDKRMCKEKIYNLIQINEGHLEEEFLIKRSLVDGEYGVSIKAYQEKGLIFGR